MRKAKGDVVCRLDSDNIIPDSNWLSGMMKPFEEDIIVASEPIKYAYRRKDGVINRYRALIGLNDLPCMFTGNYDRYCAVTGKWTEVEREETDKGDYLFDIDVLWELFKKNPGLRVAKVKTGIVHLFCPDTKTFYRKQNRRIKDFLYFSDAKGRKYPWNKVSKGRIGLFALCCITVVPLFAQACVGYTRKHDLQAWAYQFLPVG